jgi:putative lysine transport system substrate-binding protein
LDAFFVEKQEKRKKRMKKVLTVLMMTAMVIALASCKSSEGFDVDQASEIVVGLEAAYAPFNWATPATNEFTVPIEGQPNMYADGFDIVMASEIAEGLELRLVVKAIEWDGLIPALLAGEIDMIIAGMSPTSERAQTVLFTDEYFRSEQVLVVRQNGNYASANSLNDFGGARVVAQLGTLQDDLIDQIDGVNDLPALNDYPTLITALLNNAADAFVAELPVALGAVAANPNELSIVTLVDGFIVSDEDVIVSVALRQEDLDLQSRINDILQTISSETRNAYMEQALSRQPQ